MTAPRSANRILVSSSSSKIPLLRSLVESASRVSPELIVLAGDHDPLAISSFFDWEFIRTPETTDQNALLMLKLLVESGVRLVFPTRDGELEFWARHAGNYRRAGISVVCSPSQVLAKSLDKLEFFHFATGLGLPVIFTSEDPHAIESPALVVKERWGSGSAGLSLNVQRETAIRQAAYLKSPIFQPYIKGRELSADVWRSKDGQQCFCSLRVRDIVHEGEARVTTTIRDEAVEEIVVELAQALGLVGPGVAQIILDEKNTPHIIEFNARFGGASTASIAAGFPILDLTLSDFLDVPSPPFPYVEPRHIRQVRYPMDLIIEDPSI